MQIKWTAGNGKQIEITTRAGWDSVEVSATVDGKRELSNRINKLPAPRMVGTVEIVAVIGNVGLTRERYLALEADIAALQAEIDARPDVILRRLVDQRTAISREIGYILDAAHEAHVTFIEQASEHGFAKESKRDYIAEEAAARSRLAEFDAAHPEALVEIAKQKQERLDSFMRSN